MKYALYDTYEAEIEPGELICTSDSMAEIRAAAKVSLNRLKLERR